MNYHISDQVHLLANLTSIETATAVYVPLSVCSNSMSLLVGFCVIDRLSTRGKVRALCFAHACSLGVMVLAMNMHSESLVYCYGAYLGVCTGTKLAVASVLWASVFGRKALGKIQGFATALGIGSTGTGPVLFGMSRDMTGRYDAAIMGCIAFQTITVLMLLCAPIPDWRRAGEAEMREAGCCCCAGGRAGRRQGGAKGGFSRVAVVDAAETD